MGEEKTDSEFGKGLTYCLGLFLAHAERYSERDGDWAENWFNGASDHLYELEIPETLAESLRTRLKEFQDKVLSWGHGFGMNGRPKAVPTDVEWSLQEAKDLLREIDSHFGVATVKGSWE